MILLRRVFIQWFTSLMALFVFLNLVGYLPLHNEGKRFVAGFPCVITEWIIIGEYRETNFYPSAIFINAAVSLGIALLLITY